MNQKVFQRDAFIEEIFFAAEKDRNIFFLSADFGAPALDIFRETLPTQFLHCGISEQNMIDMAAGLALSGKQVYVYAMAPFITLRCIEQIKCSLAMMNLPVTVLAVGVGLGYADAGPTHYATEDIACMRSLAGVEVWSPCDNLSTRSIARTTLTSPGLRVIRLERDALPEVYSQSFNIDGSGFQEIEKGIDICVLSYGHLLHRSLKSRKDKSGAAFGVVDIFRLKPISNRLADTLNKYRGIVTVEEHCLHGGFGSAVLEFLSDRGLKMPVTRLGLPERYYFENGGREYLLDKFGLSVEDIGTAVDQLTNI